MFDLFIYSFINALSGALSPGPVTTFTIYKSLESKKGYLVGWYITLGYAILEFILIIFIIQSCATYERVTLEFLDILLNILKTIGTLDGIRSGRPEYRAAGSMNVVHLVGRNLSGLTIAQ